MNRSDIKIDRLEIRLRGVQSEAAREAVGDLGHELMGQLAAEPHLLRGRLAVRIGKIDSGSFRRSGEMTSSELRRLIARRLAASIISQLK